MKRHIAFVAGQAMATTLATLVGPSAAQTQPTWTEIGPLFAERCVVCRSGAAAPAGLQLDTLAHALTGGANCPVLALAVPMLANSSGGSAATASPACRSPENL